MNRIVIDESRFLIIESKGINYEIFWKIIDHSLPYYSKIFFSIDSSRRKFTLPLDYYSFSTNRIGIDDSRFLTINREQKD